MRVTPAILALARDFDLTRRTWLRPRQWRERSILFGQNEWEPTCRTLQSPIRIIANRRIVFRHHDNPGECGRLKHRHTHRQTG